jgi:hypothetical protein
MGHLLTFPLGNMMQEFQVGTFFETGTGFGFGLYYASMFPFRQLFSVDIIEADVARLMPAFNHDTRIRLVAGKSVDVLRQTIPFVQGNILFWLDAHYPGADYSGRAYDAEKDIDVRLPLEQELSLIKSLRPGKRDVILIDDLRIYETDKFEWGNMKDAGKDNVRKTDSNFLYEMFQDTHNHKRFLNHSGYLALLPKSAVA